MFFFLNNDYVFKRDFEKASFCYHFQLFFSCRLLPLCIMSFFRTSVKISVDVSGFLSFPFSLKILDFDVFNIS